MMVQAVGLGTEPGDELDLDGNADRQLAATGCLGVRIILSFELGTHRSEAIFRCP
jgi:hypothetical protein